MEFCKTRMPGRSLVRQLGRRCGTYRGLADGICEPFSHGSRGEDAKRVCKADRGAAICLAQQLPETNSGTVTEKGTGQAAVYLASDMCEEWRQVTGSWRSNQKHACWSLVPFNPTGHKLGCAVSPGDGMPMNKLRIFAWTLLLIALMGTGIADSQSVSSAQRVLAYSAKPAPHPNSFLLKSPHGVTYRLSLVPELDVKKHVVVLDLVLQKPGQTEDAPNLLDPTGKLHGYQPYVFAASDFAGGIQKSAYGESRVIDLPKLGMQIRIKVADVHVEPTSAGSSHGLGYQLDDLTLEITTQRLAEGRSNK